MDVVFFNDFTGPQFYQPSIFLLDICYILIFYGFGGVQWAVYTQGCCVYPKINEMGPHGSKIDYNGIIRTVFDPKITFPTCVRVKNNTFYQSLKIFTKFKKKSKKCVLNQSKNKNINFYFFLIFKYR